MGGEIYPFFFMFLISPFLFGLDSIARHNQTFLKFTFLNSHIWLRHIWKTLDHMDLVELTKDFLLDTLMI